MISAVFFPRGELLLRRASTADSLVDLQQLLRQFTKAVIGLDFALRLLQFGIAGKGFGHGLSFHFTSQAKVGAVPGLVGLMATAAGLAAGTLGGGDRSTAKVGQCEHLLQDGAALLFQLGEGFFHG
jgi:hypothetical protein